MDPVEVSAPLRARQLFLLQSQNSDGGWGYFARPGQSWLEPTAYAALALTRVPEATPALAKTLTLISEWQGADGAFPPNGNVRKSSWVTALGTTLSAIQGANNQAARGAKHLLAIHGAEADAYLTKIVKKVLPPVYLDRDPFLPGWPWQEHAWSWIEPTAHSIVALRVAAANDAGARERIDVGQRMILSLRCKDGGWNYGSRSALNVELPSYPETTALALLGLHGRPKSDLAGPLDVLRTLSNRPQAPLARAWLNVSLAVYGLPAVAASAEVLGDDVLLAAVEALGTPGGNAHLLRGQSS